MREDMEVIWQAMKGTHYQRVLDQLAKDIRQTKVLKEALSIAIESVVKAIHAETGTLWFYDRRNTGKIHPRAVSGGGDMAGVALAPGEGIAGQVIQSGKSVIIRDCQADPRWAGRVDKKTGFTTRSMICVPLSLGSATFGSIQIINNVDGLLFDEKDLTFTERLATEIALLLNDQGLLEGQLVDTPRTADFSFRDWMLTGTIRNVERRLHTLPEFAAMTHGEQQEVIQLSKKLWKCFEKQRR